MHLIAKVELLTVTIGNVTHRVGFLNLKLLVLGLMGNYAFINLLRVHVKYETPANALLSLPVCKMNMVATAVSLHNG